MNDTLKLLEKWKADLDLKKVAAEMEKRANEIGEAARKKAVEEFYAT